MSKRRDKVAEEFGTFGWLSEPDQPPSTREQALDALETHLAHGHELRPLHGRAPITEDPFLPSDWIREWYGEPSKGPTIPEIQQLRREYADAVDDTLNGRTQPQAPQGERWTGTPEELAETLWTEFRDGYPQLAGDAAAVEAAAKRIIEAGSFDPDNRAAFYSAVAKELGSDG